MRFRIFASVAITVVVLAWYCSAVPQKRPPSNIGFVGTRGKRSVASGEDNEKDKRLPAGFVGLRGKKPLSSESSSYPIAALYPEETVDKRVPSGFLGVRGKKEEGFEDDGHYVESFYKRAPSGFIGMRGRRDDMYEPFQEKRKAPLGFIGMRGKKDFDTNLDIKRVPAFGFFGTRGKKLSRSGFFGTRGKKYPYQFRGKFVGVRGKKASKEVYAPDYYDENDELARLTHELDLNQLMLLLTASDDSNALLSNDPQQIK